MANFDDFTEENINQLKQDFKDSQLAESTMRNVLSIISILILCSLSLSLITLVMLIVRMV